MAIFIGDFMAGSRVPSAEELKHATRILSEWIEFVSNTASPRIGEEGQGGRSKDDSNTLTNVAIILYEFRRIRAQSLPAELFGEPAWDILLDLFINSAQGRRISVSSLCVAADSPTTTALRHIGVLEQHGFITRAKSEHDHRVTYVELTPEGERAMLTHLSNVAARLEEAALWAKQLEQ